MEIAAVVSTITSAVGGVVSYVGAQRQADALDMAAVSAENEANFQAQLDTNESVAAQAEIEATKASTIFNKNLKAQMDAEARENLASEIADKNATSYLKLSPSVRAFSDVFKAEVDREQSKLTSFDFETGQESYNFYKQAEELDRKSAYAYSQGIAQRGYTLAAGANKATQYRNEANATRTAATVGLATSATGTLGSYANFGGSEMIKSSSNQFARKFFRVT